MNSGSMASTFTRLAMLFEALMPTHDVPKASLHLRKGLLPALMAATGILFPTSGCTRSAPASLSDGRAVVAQQQQVNDEIRKELELIPPPSKTRYLAVKSLSSWENPYITVQGGMVSLHVTLADANTSTLGQGSMLRPVGARRQNLDVRAGELPAALNAVPQSAWPYGRVIAVEEAHDAPVNARPQIRRNMEIVIRSLGDLGVVVYEWNEGGPGLR